MPTASGRETAQEKRDRQHAARWAKINAAVAALPAGWAESEAAAMMADEAARVAAGGPSYHRTERSYATHPEAVAVARAMEAHTSGYVSVATVYDMRHGGPETYRVAVPWAK